MKKFLIRILLFWGIFIGIYSIFIIRFIYLSNKVSFEIEPNKNILVLGDSQGQFCISDTIIGNTYNLCRWGEGYLPNYLKLKRVLNSPNQIDTLLLIFTPLKTDKNADKTDFSPETVNHTLGKYYPFFSKEEFKLFSFPYFMQGVLRSVTYTDISFQSFGSSGMLYGNHIETVIEKQNKKTPDKTFYGNKVELKYLNKILSLCADHNIQVILFSPPMYQADKFYDTSNFYKIYHKEYSHIPFCDMTEINFPDSCMADINHLNIHGARRISHEIKEIGLQNFVRKYPPSRQSIFTFPSATSQ